MTGSPIAAVLRAVDSLDVDACVSMLSPTCRLLLADGRTANGAQQGRAVLGDFMAALHATTHRITSEWNPEPDVWIAEVEATYELLDRGLHGPYQRAVILI